MTAIQNFTAPAELAELVAALRALHPAIVTIDGNVSRVKWLGAKMSGGSLHIRGSAGMHAGSTMTSGTITIDGDADDWLGAEMRGGLIHVRGRAGHHAGAAYPGSRAGMRGGTLLVHGVTGDGTGAISRRIRRGKK